MFLLFIVVGVPTSRMADESMLSSLQEVGLKNRKIVSPPVEIHEVKTINKDQNHHVQHVPNQEDNQLYQNNKRGRTEVIEIHQRDQPSTLAARNCSKNMSATFIINEEELNSSTLDTKIDVKKPLVTFKEQTRQVVKNRFTKRRRDLVNKADSSSTDCSRVKKICKYAPAPTGPYKKDEECPAESLLIENDKNIYLPKLNTAIGRTILDISSMTMETDATKVENQELVGSLPNGENNKSKTEEIVIAATHVTHTSATVSSTTIKHGHEMNPNVQEQNVVENLGKSSQVKIADALVVETVKQEQRNDHAECIAQPSNQFTNTNVVQNNPQSATDNKNKVNYDIKIYRGSWAIRNFLKSLNAEEQEPVDENVYPVDDEMESEEVYESVSHNIRLRI